MADNVPITAGTGTNIKTDEGGSSGGHMQVVKLAYSADGDETLIPAAANGLAVDVKAVAGNVTVTQSTATNLKVDASDVPVPVTDNSGSLTVDAPAGTPVFVRLSDGSAAITALPVTDNGASITVDDGGGILTVDGAVAATQSGTWNVATLTSITDPVAVTDNGASLTVDDGGGILTVDGTVTADQGAAAAVSAGWPVKLTDGTNTVPLGTGNALQVEVIGSSGSGTSISDGGAYVEGTTAANPMSGVRNDSASGDVAEDRTGAVRISPKRALHVELRSDAGSEIGTSGSPVRVDPTGVTAQPVTETTNLPGILTAVELLDDGIGTDGSAAPTKGMMAAGTDGTNAQLLSVNTSGHLAVHDGGGSLSVDGTVTANQGTANATPWNSNTAQIGGAAAIVAAAGIAKVGLSDEAGASFAASNPLPVAIHVPEDTFWHGVNTYSASQTDVTIRTPTGGRRFFVQGIVVTVTGAGVLKIYDNTNAAGTMIYQGTPGAGTFAIPFTPGWASAALNNVLRYSTGSGSAGDISVWGYEI